MSDKEFLIRAINMVDFDGSAHLPTVVYYPPSGPRLIGQAAMARSTTQAAVIEDFKVELGNIDPGKKGGGRRLFFTPGGSPKDAATVTADFLHGLFEQVRSWLNAQQLETKVSILLAEPLSMRSAVVSDEWLANYRKHLHGLLAGYEEIAEVDFMPEPFAAFQYYRHGMRHPLVAQRAKNNALVIDFGGGTFDVCVIETTKEGDISRTGRNSRPLAAASTPVGGYFINRRIAETLFKKRYAVDAQLKRGLQQYWDWRAGKVDLGTLDLRYRNFICHFHGVAHQAERLKIALCRSITSWDLEKDTARAVLASLPADPFADDDCPAVEARFTALDFQTLFAEDVWARRLKSVVNQALQRAKEELSGAPISVVLLSGGSANIGWLRTLLARDCRAELGDSTIVQLDDFQEVVAKGLAIECARRFYTEDGDFAAVTYNRLCLLLNPDKAGRQPRSFRPRNPELPHVQTDPGVLLPSASVLRALVDRPMQWKVHLEKPPKQQLDYFYMRSSLDPDDIASRYNVEETTVHTPKKCEFDRDLKLELRVTADGTAYPRFIYKSGRDDAEQAAVDGRPFALDMTYTGAGRRARAYLGLDFGSSNTAVSFVEERQIEVFRQRQGREEWRELGELYETLPYPLALPLGRYLTSGGGESALEFVEAVLALAAYLAYCEYCVSRGRAETRLLKNLSHRSAGPLWGLLRECLGRSRESRLAGAFSVLLEDQFQRRLEAAIEALNQEKHHKAMPGGGSSLEIVQLLGNLAQKTFSHARFGFFEDVQKRGFARNFEGRFRDAAGASQFFRSLPYSGSEAFSSAQAVVVVREKRQCLPLTPLVFWSSCDRHPDLDIGHCYFLDKADDRAHEYSFKAAGFACTLLVALNGELGSLAEEVRAFRDADPVLAWAENVEIHGPS